MLPKEQQIRSKQQLKEWLACELAKLPKSRSPVLITEADILRRHQILLRKTEYHVNCRHKLVGLVYLMRLRRLQNRYAIHIPLNVCGKGLRIMHTGPILINGKAVVGENCAFHINTALVAGGTSNDAPVLGNGVVVGVGAVVLGGVHIADNVAIGAGAVVNKDVTEENVAVAGVPAKKVSNNGRAQWNKKNPDHQDA